MQDFITQHISEFITALAAGTAGWFFQRKKQQAELHTSEIENADKALKYYREMIDDLAVRLQQAIAELNEAKTTIKSLQNREEELITELKKYKQLSGKIVEHAKDIQKLKNEQNGTT